MPFWAECATIEKRNSSIYALLVDKDTSLYIVKCVSDHMLALKEFL